MFLVIGAVLMNLTLGFGQRFVDVGFFLVQRDSEVRPTLGFDLVDLEDSQLIFPYPYPVRTCSASKFNADSLDVSRLTSISVQLVGFGKTMS